MNTKEAFTPENTSDHLCDITLVAKDGKEVKVHWDVLADSSTFFEKLLNSGMKEPKEGVVRLDMLTEPLLGDILEFLYTGSVQILAEDRARDLIAMADYCILPHLTNLAGRALAQHLNSSNCVSIYHSAEKYHCEELISYAKNTILAIFSAIAKTEEFLNMSSEEVEMFISNDDIEVSVEEDVFEFILMWIGRDKVERNKFFSQLFRQIRLVHVSQDYLPSNIMTNELVEDNEGCLDLVKDAIKLIDSTKCDYHSVTPRKSLEVPVLLLL